MPSQIIQLENVSKQYDRRTILPPLDLTIFRGDFLAVTGPNGGGKTTLLKVILKLVEPSTGFVKYFNRSGRTVKNLNIGYVPQKNTIDPMFPITADEVVESGFLCSGWFGRKSQMALKQSIMDGFGLSQLKDKPLGVLSGGQMQRVLIARALVTEPDMLVLDEPLSYLDRHYTDVLIDVLQRLKARTTVIVVSHDMTQLASLASRHLIVDHNICEMCKKHHPHPLID